ncbi:2-hydroxyacid dehydrogenase [Catenovulum sp. 2E275]|uniref:2-hydroxyacid dehydrogenase n=1 Tax=Catenovulum sp. 2E275 TaxID=2980497 RepID=UPI0021D10660|nr:2-hydroxyacid dehydrogenase [Catenovulum sp. 2E275]MCU4675330.1 2-hydroxyacid dehydrogenase [Catenovulum sp. 2E275]
MKLAVFNSKSYDKTFFTQNLTAYPLDITYFDVSLNQQTAELAAGFSAVCIFVNDIADKTTLDILKAGGTELIALRCAGFNNVDVQYAKQIGLKICRVPEYSPEAVAEHTVGLMLTLSRKFHKAYNRVKEDNFSLVGLMGFNLHNKTVGIIGTGKIGLAVAKILTGFGCKLLCYDPNQSEQIKAVGGRYVELDQLIAQSDIISLHCPLMPQTQYLINHASIDKMKPNVMLINTSRGGLLKTDDVLQALKQKKIGYLGLDVYELEANLFFEDLSTEIIDDDIFQRLLTFPNVLVTGHQGFFTEEALNCIAQTTLNNVITILNGEKTGNELF